MRVKYAGMERVAVLEKGNKTKQGSLQECACNSLQAFYGILLYKGSQPEVTKGKKVSQCCLHSVTAILVVE